MKPKKLARAARDINRLSPQKSGRKLNARRARRLSYWQRQHDRNLA